MSSDAPEMVVVAGVVVVAVAVDAVVVTFSFRRSAESDVTAMPFSRPVDDEFNTRCAPSAPLMTAAVTSELTSMLEFAEPLMSDCAACLTALPAAAVAPAAELAGLDVVEMVDMSVLKPGFDQTVDIDFGKCPAIRDRHCNESPCFYNQATVSFQKLQIRLRS
ncbi:hypothetical protein FAZ69_30635 [Trinickia terrae]|uniref:Uncharacterized protein n=1 Tax=Trinickia terrae TaxID=2571161 RepID=A0A4U1HE76_9BURK|nr:hypothetical protein [Trinickia terrae]TKC79221.1 hypothetical protein FAZ69_30635 [Trinickia terrae]